jgi:ASC-1-like (ASCH) protein
MKTHELKLDIKYFDDVKSGKKNFEIRKNDRDFQVGDVLQLKAYENGMYRHTIQREVRGKGFEDWTRASSAEQADTIKVKVVDIIIPKDWWSILNKFGINNDPVMTKSGFMFSPKEVLTVLEDYFSTDRLPDGYVILGVEVVK